MWTHNSRPINFTLLVHNFGVKYSVKYHALHLKEDLENKYKVTINWKGKIVHWDSNEVGL